MAPRSPSHSEGEYFSSDTDVKATKPQSRRKNYDVDRSSRPYASARSARSRSRSRSPYRAPRGEKRRRDDDHARSKNDSRSFNARYEDDSRPRHASRGDRDSKRSRTFSPSRSRSRSPYRASKDFKENKKDAGQTKPSVSAQSNGSVKGTIKNDAKTSDQKSTTVDIERNSVGSRNDSVNPSTMDEAALIEARRKRREAIKSKYKNQEPSLLVQALHVQSDPTSRSETVTPTRSVSPSPAVQTSIPGTPGSINSAPQSPTSLSFTRDEDFANEDIASPRSTDEPSAADYDPTVDMQEERARHDKRLFKEDEKSLEQADQQVLEHSKEATREKQEFDMFAEDDDMFAASPVATAKPVQRAAQALNATMMDNWDDHEGYYITILGELIEGRYHVTQNLGRGMFSSVVRATDTQNDQLVAIKIVRNNESMRKAGIKEIDILKDIATNDVDDKRHVIRLHRSFDHKGHLCMIFENLSMNLREVLKKFGRDVGINMKVVRAYARQLFLGISLLKQCQYLHADLKPDNILVNDSMSTVKIADLGSASLISENAIAPYLVSRFYRAPEVILGVPYDYGIDMWSIGCTLFELYTGKILFTGRNNNNMLRTIMECRGKFPNKLLRRGSLTYDYFDDVLNFLATEPDKITGRMVTKLVDIKARPIRDLRSRLFPRGKRMEEQERRELESFLDLLDKCLALDPAKRITPNEALKHPFITKVI